MLVEPGVIDTNVLVYGLDADAPQHVPSRRLLHAGRLRTNRLYVTSQILCEFYSIVTNARRVARPRNASDAIGAIQSLLSFLVVLPVPVRTVEGWLDLLRRRPVTGGDVFDLQLAATMLANGISTIYTFNTGDFEGFPEISVAAPDSL